MVVAMFAVLAMDVAVDDVIDMTRVRDRRVLAAHAVQMLGRMRIARVLRVARQRLEGPEFVLVHVIFVRMVEVAVVNVIHVVLVLHGEMSAAGAVDVRVPVMHVAFGFRFVRHERSSLSIACCKPPRTSSAT